MSDRRMPSDEQMRAAYGDKAESVRKYLEKLHAAEDLHRSWPEGGARSRRRMRREIRKTMNTGPR